MPPRATSRPFLPFLYPSLYTPLYPPFPRTTLVRPTSSASPTHTPPQEDSAEPEDLVSDSDPPALPLSRLNPSPDDYTAPTFADKTTLVLHAGRGGHGCISFHREAFRPDGPPDGGNGGPGGCIYIQAVPGETSLHKLARRRVVRAGRGTNGKGGGRAGTVGEDVILLVPVGTVVREIERVDPAAEDEERRTLVRDLRRRQRKRRAAAAEAAAAAAAESESESTTDKGEEAPEAREAEAEAEAEEARASAQDAAELERLEDQDRGQFLIYPGMSRSEARGVTFPRGVPHLYRPVLQPAGPIGLDLARASAQPVLLAAGGAGGLGNPHFASRETPRPVVATRGGSAVTLTVELELKLLADVGLVGLPNAGKSTLLRALSNSRARVGSWAFTTLRPNVGTVVLDRYQGRPAVEGFVRDGHGDGGGRRGQPERRNRFTVADIPGLIEDAHLDRGLGIEFLRHVERAAVLAFVLDLGTGDAVAALRALWREVGLYSRMRAEAEADVWDQDQEEEAEAEGAHGIVTKPWFVVANKGDLPDTQANFGALSAYLDRVTAGQEPHPSGVEGGWTDRCVAIPVSAILGQGVDRVVHWMVGLLGETCPGRGGGDVGGEKGR